MIITGDLSFQILGGCYHVDVPLVTLLCQCQVLAMLQIPCHHQFASAVQSAFTILPTLRSMHMEIQEILPLLGIGMDGNHSVAVEITVVVSSMGVDNNSLMIQK